MRLIIVLEDNQTKDKEVCDLVLATPGMFQAFTELAFSLGHDSVLGFDEVMPIESKVEPEHPLKVVARSLRKELKLKAKIKLYAVFFHTKFECNEHLLDSYGDPTTQYTV